MWLNAFYMRFCSKLKVAQGYQEELDQHDQWIIFCIILCVVQVALVVLFWVFLGFLTNHVIYCLLSWGWEWQIKFTEGQVIRRRLLRPFNEKPYSRHIATLEYTNCLFSYYVTLIEGEKKKGPINRLNRWLVFWFFFFFLPILQVMHIFIFFFTIIHVKHVKSLILIAWLKFAWW